MRRHIKATLNHLFEITQKCIIIRRQAKIKNVDVGTHIKRKTPMCAYFQTNWSLFLLLWSCFVYYLPLFMFSLFFSEESSKQLPTRSSLECIPRTHLIPHTHGIFTACHYFSSKLKEIDNLFRVPTFLLCVGNHKLFIRRHELIKIKRTTSCVLCRWLNFGMT